MKTLRSFWIIGLALSLFVSCCVTDTHQDKDTYFNGDITIIKAFDKDTLLCPIKIELEDIYTGSVLAYDSLLFFISSKYSDYWIYVFDCGK